MEKINIKLVTNANPGMLLHSIRILDCRNPDGQGGVNGYVSSIERSKYLTDIDRISVRIDSGYELIFYVPSQDSIESRDSKGSTQ